jgi:hypothetical protein
MGLLSTNEKRDVPQSGDGPRWEYKARNLGKVLGMGMEADFNKFGREGWEFVAVARDYALFKRRLETD